MDDNELVDGIGLPGLDGTNPLGFLAGLGVVASLTLNGRRAALRWTDGPIPNPVVEGCEDFEHLRSVLANEVEQWRDEWIVISGLTDVKFAGNGPLRSFLDDARRAGSRSQQLAEALVTEGSFDNLGNAKPTDFHFTAGQQQWLGMARQLCESVSVDDIMGSISGPWGYSSKLPSLGWDTTDDRVYALSARNPSKEKKLTEPGVEFLALLGLTAFAVQTGERTLTPGCNGRWKTGKFTWPLWTCPLEWKSISSLVSFVSEFDDEGRVASLGANRLLQSSIRRSDQGGYGTFGPPVTLWQRSR